MLNSPASLATRRLWWRRKARQAQPIYAVVVVIEVVLEAVLIRSLFYRVG
jgi:hypothetical protein